MKRQNKIVNKVLLISMILLVSSCSTHTPEELKPVKVRLKWLHQAQFAGNYIAKEKGFYEDNGLDVELLEGGVDHPAIPDVLSGNSDYGIAGADDLIVAVSEGKLVKAIAVIYKYSPVTYFSIDESIKTPYDFIGKKIGIKTGTGTTYSYVSMINNLDIDRSRIEEIEIGDDLEELYEGKVDVWPGFRINEPKTAEEAGYEVYQVYPEDWGVSVYADVLFTTREKIDNNPDEVKAFVQSTLQGWDYVIENEQETIDIVMQYINTSREHQEYMLEKSIPLIHTGDSQIGYMEEESWKNQVDLLVENKVIESPLNISRSFTNEFIIK